MRVWRYRKTDIIGADLTWKYGRDIVVPTEEVKEDKKKEEGKEMRVVLSIRGGKDKDQRTFKRFHNKYEDPN